MTTASILFSSCVALMSTGVLGHGHMTIPTGRTNGTVESAGDCFHYGCFWFSQITEIPGKPTVNDPKYRTFNVDVSSGPDDWSATMPWRAPGTAPVRGSGCGVAGGSDTELDNGGIPPPGIAQGVDALDVLPPNAPVTWKRGSTQEVGFGIFANHGGGYQWRLCRMEEGVKVTEECFQKTPLKFVGTKSWLRYAPVQQWGKLRRLPDVEIDRVTVSEGTYPPGSQWARNPMPGCLLCDQAECMPPRQNLSWIEQQHCSQSCSGLNMTQCPPGMTQFPEPAAGVSGYYQWRADDDTGLAGFKFSVVDLVEIPSELKPGQYLLSWRWDCEQSRQIWQNCADITIA